MNELEKMKNIGKKLAGQLNEVGIHTKDDFESVGSMEAWSRIKEIDPTSCGTKLLALEAALQNVNMEDVDSKDRERLRDFVQTYK